MSLRLLKFAVLLAVLACNTSRKGMVNEPNPPADGFDSAGSDEKAIAIADKVMEAMGGRKAWDDTKVLAWNFFGNRHLIWNKQTGDVRIDSKRDTAVLLANVYDNKVRAQVKGVEVTDPTELSEWRKKAKGIWINDSYWLVMPFKLKDSGVTLKYLRKEKTEAGAMADVLQLTFKGVGVTPDNKYEVWVDQSDHLIKQWAFYRNYTDEEPNRVWPWDNYKQMGKIKLSGDRSDESGPRFVRIYDKVPQGVFREFTPPDLVLF